MFYSFCSIRQTLDGQSKQNKNNSTNKGKSFVSSTGKLLEPRWRLFFLPFFLFSFAIFVGSICIFQKSTKENSPGAEMANLHIEDLTEREREWERGKREGEREGEKKRVSKWFEDNLKEAIISISCLRHAHYAGVIAIFTSTKTDYLLSLLSSFTGRERESEGGGREREREGEQREKCAS